VVGAMMDITARKQAEERLLESELNLLEAQRIAHLGSWVWNLKNDELEWSKEQRRIFGYPLESGKLVYQNFIDAIFPEDKELVLKAIEQAKKTGKISDLEVRIQRPDGSKHWISIQGEAITDESGTPEKMVGTSIDITERKLLEEQLKYQAVHDQLTGLYNRRVLQERLTAEGARATRYNHPLAVFMLDVDHFKRINDTHGHLVGDLVLQTLASTLETSTRKTDVLARYGGEEFVVVLPETSLETAQLLAERLREAIADRAVMLEHGERIDVTASIGIACFPTHSRTPQDLLTIADRALYQAKQNGRNRVSTPNAPDHSTNVALELPST
jgi:diguanylate cyclase (GGDEF)-like protein/PAS domain S-box-containing protein